MSSETVNKDNIQENEKIRKVNEHSEFFEVGRFYNKINLTSNELEESLRNLRYSSVLQIWMDCSKINYVSAMIFEDISRDPQFRSIRFSCHDLFDTTKDAALDKTEDNVHPIEKRFSIHLTPLTNESNLWGCFYNFPELYNNVYSPVVRVKTLDNIPASGDGVLTIDVVAAGLSYLKRTPILGDYVYIKLDLSMKLLVNIDILQYYKYIVYLDLSSNSLSEISVLSRLPYLQYLSVDFNRIPSVLDYDTPQWFLTEVRYRYNIVVDIRDLTSFWSITILELSHNNIKYITGLQNLRYLRRLDLSFNHIRRLENLNHLRLLWLDVSHNNISSFECGPNVGLWTLLHLEYLKISDNNVKSLKIFSGCTRLRELHACNNCFSVLLEVPSFMRSLRRLIILDLRLNPICKVDEYMGVIVNTFPVIFQLDGAVLDPIDIRTAKMDMTPEISTFAGRRLLRLLYIQQLSKAKVSPYVPPADNKDVPLVVLVGQKDIGKGTLARRIAEECNTNVELAVQHTTGSSHFLHDYKVITRRKFDNMLLAGEFLTYSEMDGQSYGLSRDEAFVSNGKVKIVTMDLIGALMLKLRGYRPYLILALYSDEQVLNKEREKIKRNLENIETHTTLQVLLSGRIIINGILRDILENITSQETQKNDFIMDSDCSLLMESDLRTNKKVTGIDRMALLNPGTSNILQYPDQRDGQKSSSLFSIYAVSPDRGQYVSNTYDLHDKSTHKKGNETKQYKTENEKGYDKQAQSSKDFTATFQSGESRNTFKSVTFTTVQTTNKQPGIAEVDPQKIPGNNFIKTATPAHELNSNSELWAAFLRANQAQRSNTNLNIDASSFPECITNSLKQHETFTPNIGEDYENIHRNWPGLFWDTIIMDDHETAFIKLKKIVKDIVNDQKKLKPLFDIDFTNNNHYEIIEKKAKSISRQIAPQQLFY